MNQQLAIDFNAARAVGEQVAQACLAKAERDFDKDAMGYLIKFVRKSKRRPFFSEHVTLAALEDGIAPDSLKDWGPIFVQAATNGLIKRCESTWFRRTRGNGTKTLGWIAA